MAVSYEETGRTKQKSRTRAALLDAARGLMARGLEPTVEEAAKEALVSRATAYRYFPNQQALLVATYPAIAERSLLDEDAPTDPEARLELVVERMTAQIVDHEPELRAMLRVSLEPAPDPDRLPLRKGRAIAWIEDALEPLRDRMSARELRRLVLAIRATTGIEALVWLTDVAGLSRHEAVDLMRLSARRLLRAALAEL